MDANFAPPDTQAPAPSSLGIGQLARLFRRNLWLIAGCFLLGATAAFIYAEGLPKSYTAAAMLAVEGDRITIPQLQGALSADSSPDPMPWVHTEVLALQSRQLIQGVIDELHIARDPEFNAALRPPTLLGEIKSAIASLLPKHASKPGAGAADDALLGAVNRALTITQDNRSLVIGVAFTAHDPNLAAGFVNTLIHDYIAERERRRASANVGANTVVTARIEQVRKDIDAIEQKMRTLRQTSDMVGLRAGSVGQQQVEDLATAASRATLERSQIEAQWERASALAAQGSSDALASVLGSETISRLRAQQTEASEKVADLSQRFGPNYPALRSAEADLASVRRQVAEETHRIVASLATQLTVARAHEADVLRQLDQARHAGVAAQNIQSELDQLAQDAATRRDLYRTLLESAQQTQSQPQGTTIPDVRLLSTAVPPGLPSAPNMKLATGFGAAGGAILGCMLALLRTARSGTPFDAEAFARRANVTIIGTLRRTAARRGRLASLVLAEPGGADAEALRLSLARLRHVGRLSPRVVAFAGAQSGPAAAGVAGAFARIAAGGSQRVLLIDNGPDPSLARAMDAAPGLLAEVLAGDTAWRDALVADRIPSLDLLLGKGGSAPARSAVGLENLLAEAQEEYDLIILGAAQALDTQGLAAARRSDVTVLVIDPQAVDDTTAAETLVRLSDTARRPVAALLFS